MSNQNAPNSVSSPILVLGPMPPGARKRRIEYVEEFSGFAEGHRHPDRPNDGVRRGGNARNAPSSSNSSSRPTSGQGPAIYTPSHSSRSSASGRRNRESVNSSHRHGPAPSYHSQAPSRHQGGSMQPPNPRGLGSDRPRRGRVEYLHGDFPASIRANRGDPQTPSLPSSASLEDWQNHVMENPHIALPDGQELPDGEELPHGSEPPDSSDRSVLGADDYSYGPGQPPFGYRVATCNECGQNRYVLAQARDMPRFLQQEPRPVQHEVAEDNEAAGAQGDLANNGQPVDPEVHDAAMGLVQLRHSS
ncbi:hypothetical protein K491DRAFT_690452 [Lophiostoma macrostomum CBS 122681]|uniref:Uncharacterized protein n=1 Tax=Lophiostoma macrostomum CBS 122681 TaxID=1314788 RepID=A0A6A6TEF3_9PLEO|nr:hypothetical protein K491DRAFT_690452 [Lophiostoma macrostomum CBS 122681]